MPVFGILKWVEKRNARDIYDKLDGISESMRRQLLDILDQRLQPYFEAIESELPDLDRDAYASELEKRVDVETMFQQICDEYREMLIGGKLH